MVCRHRALTGFFAAPLGKHFELLECSGLSCGNQRINALQSSFRNDDQRSLVSAFMTRARPSLKSCFARVRRANKKH